MYIFITILLVICIAGMGAGLALCRMPPERE